MNPSFQRSCALRGSVVRQCRPTQDVGTIKRTEIKRKLDEKLTGLNRGIFGIKVNQDHLILYVSILQAAMKNEIVELLEDLENSNQILNPTEKLELVAGDWKLLFSTIKITGSKRTKLGLRQFVDLGEFIQTIDIQNSVATNVVNFTVMGLGALNGCLRIEAIFTPISDKRVEITLQAAILEPEALQKLFEDNFDLLLGIFNPAGWLDITYVDETHRIGRDDKHNLFYLERIPKPLQQ